MFIKKAAINFTGNKFMQQILERTITISQYLMGIGSGTGVESSGERAVLNILQNQIKPPYCIFDIGANQGQYLSLLVNFLKNNNYTIHCFEPGCYTFDILKTNSAQIKSDKIVLNNCALGKTNGEMVLYYDQPGSGLASLTKRKLDHFGINFSTSEKVKIQTLDDYCTEHKINQIHLLKCDVEGHELDVFTGASSMFSKGAINIVTFEFGGCNIDTRTFFQDFYYFFKEMGMEIFRITPSGYLKSIDLYKEVDEQFRTTNYVALKKYS